MGGGRLSRREVLGAGAAAGVALAARGAVVARAAGSWTSTLDFGALGAGEGWPGWACAGVANMRRRDGLGVFEAGSDVFPCDPRPVAFAVDQRFRDGAISAQLKAIGAGSGVVVRRTGPRGYYAAIVDAEQSALLIVRRFPDGVAELARILLLPAAAPLRLSLTATGAFPTHLIATVETATGERVTARASDSARALQRAGDPGVLATARTLLPSEGPAVLPALGNPHLLVYGVDGFEPEAAALLPAIRERSTALLTQITVSASGSPAPSRPSVVAASTGAPLAGGAVLRLATDVPARVEIEIASHPSFRKSRRIRAGITDDFNAVFGRASGLPTGKRVYWRARMRRHGRETIGPARSFRVLPRAGSSAPATIAIGACASQFGPIFGRLAALRPDTFVWQGDLNYPDTVGPLAQNIGGYAGIWRDFFANPKLRSIFEQSHFAAQRDDHDYGVQDANSTNLVPWGLTPWESLVEGRHFYRFTAGHAEFWVLDQRRFKSAPTLPDGPGKTLLGQAQRDWLFRTLAASPAAFKVICSPCTVAPLPANGHDGSWATRFTAERDLLLAHIRAHVGGRTLFVTGDTHWTMVYDHDGLFEARPCPLGIPTPNDITLVSPSAAEDARRVPGVLYADDNSGHFGLVEVSGHDGVARLDLSLVREDGAVVFRRSFEEQR